MAIATAVYKAMKKTSSRWRVLGWRWTPLVVAGALVLCTLTLWRTALHEERSHRAQVLRVMTDTIKADIADDMETRYLDLDRTAQLPASLRVGPQQLQTYSQYVSRYSGCEGVAIVSPSGEAIWAVPPTDDVELRQIYFSHETAKNAFELTRRKRTLVISHAMLHHNRAFISFWSPVYKGNQFQGIVVGLFLLEPLLNAVLADSVHPGYSVAIFDGQTLPSYTLHGEDWEQQTTAVKDHVALPGIEWDLQVWPQVTPMSDGQPFSSVVLVVGSLFAGLVAVIMYLARRANAAAVQTEEANHHLTQEVAARRRAEESLHVLSGRLFKVQDEERQNLARVLHEGLAQKLFALSMNLKVASKWIPSPEVLAKFQESINVADDCVCEMRALTHLLHPPSLDVLGLFAACETFVQGFKERTGLEVTIEFADEPVRFPRDMEMALFRVVQESLANIQNQTGVTQVKIRLAHDEGLVVLEVADDRSQSNEPMSANEPGIGVAGMRERMWQLGGELHVESAVTATTVRAILPYIPERHGNAEAENRAEWHSHQDARM